MPFTYCLHYYVCVAKQLQDLPALIHISELSWNRVTDPSAILSVGQEVEVKVCRLDRYLQRISLSLKQMQVRHLPSSGIVQVPY